MYSHQIDMYRIMLLRIKRSVIRGGIIINAKPIFLITLIEMIGEGLIKNNQVTISNEVEERYRAKYEELAPGEKVTPIYRPFYHLMSDGFWHLKMTEELPAEKLTDRRLRAVTDYGYFDNVLWDILLMEDTRSFYTKLLIDNYLRK